VEPSNTVAPFATGGTADKGGAAAVGYVRQYVGDLGTTF
jgi:hypothetical protein